MLSPELIIYLVIHISSYVSNVSLVVIDEIHLLGEDRGPILEVVRGTLKQSH